ncbi:MAG: sigma-70 family RNA polymerase sigma factor [Lachnospiraceae bacterium]|nr:sigma-70 family RNA polymerase sigma factor [Lachnospiraceae bacterium]
MNADQRKSMFEVLFRSNYVKLLRYAIYVVGDDELARDAVSDAFVKLWETYDFDDGKAAESFLFVTLRNRCLDILRHISVKNDYVMRMALLIDDKDEIDIDDCDERLHRVKMLIDRLPERTRFVMEQCYIHEKTYKEVARLLDITPSGVKQHIVKGLAFIRKNFNKKDGDNDARPSDH